MTLGTDRVQLDPDHPWGAADRFKRLAAQFIDLCQNSIGLGAPPAPKLTSAELNAGKLETDPAYIKSEADRLLHLAMTHAELAAMWAVKAEVLMYYGAGKTERG